MHRTAGLGGLLLETCPTPVTWRKRVHAFVALRWLVGERKGTEIGFVFPLVHGTLTCRQMVEHGGKPARLDGVGCCETEILAGAQRPVVAFSRGISLDAPQHLGSSG